MPPNAETRMQYIEQLFMRVQHSLEAGLPARELTQFLETEPPLYRAIAYESASFVIGLQDLEKENRLSGWQQFYGQHQHVHAFHMQIGLGWAFAKAEKSPADFANLEVPFQPDLVYDGMGYYYALYRGRQTIKSQVYPPTVPSAWRPCFDQGIGRRLWYYSRANLTKLLGLLSSFPEMRQGQLWQGVGIACGYVGGAESETLEELLLQSGTFGQQFTAGMALAAKARSISGSSTPDMEMTDEMICRATDVHAQKAAIPL